MRFTVKTILICILAAILVVALAGCGSRTNTAKPGEKLKVMTTIYPVYEFTRQVGGDKVDVTMLVPPGVEPHDWEPTAKEIILLKSAKLFLYQGAGFENLDKILSSQTLGTTVAVAVSHDIPVLSPNHEVVDADTPDNDHFDSHMWLDPVAAQQEVLNIAAALAAVDPANGDYYRSNAAKYNQELVRLDQEYRQALANLPRREIVTSHAAFGYLAKRYNLRQVAIMGLSPDSEPTPEKMARVVTFCRTHNVKTIFFETVVSPKLSETVARETGARLLVLNPVESLTEAELKQEKNYTSIMRENLVNLQQALSE
jgi:zinc transport system substrate-binding protein